MNDRNDNVRLIGHFVREIASAVPVIDAIEACCPDALVDYQHMATSCPNKAHSESSIKDLTHCYVKRANGGTTWTCFACSGRGGGPDGGDSVDYVARWLGIPQLRAAQMINQAMGLNLPDPIGGMRGSVKDYVQDRVVQTPKAPKKNTAIAQAKRQTAATIDRVYQAIAAACQPDDDLRRKLQSERGMTDDEISRDIIAPIPHGIVDMLIERGITEEDMIGVPGFFQDPESGAVKFMRQGVSYGIIVRDAGGRIVGLMAKYDNSDGHKYGWYSSARRNMGISSGAPAGYLDFLDLPGEWDEEIGDVIQDTASLGRRAPIIVCEGYHKAATVRRTWGLRGIYVSGIQATGGVGQLIKQIALTDGCYLRAIVAPDTDCLINPQVMAGTLHMIDQIVSTGYAEWVRIATWDPHLGKGIDDVIRTAGPEAVHSVPLGRWAQQAIASMVGDQWASARVAMDQVRCAAHIL